MGTAGPRNEHEEELAGAAAIDRASSCENQGAEVPRNRDPTSHPALRGEEMRQIAEKQRKEEERKGGREERGGWGSSLVVEHLPRRCEILDSLPSTMLAHTHKCSKV